MIGGTVRSSLVAFVSLASSAGRPDQVRPSCLLWPDQEREFASIIGHLSEDLQIVVHGEYDPSRRSGPGLWIRAQLPRLEREGVPIIYLPGYAASELASVATFPAELQPLAAERYRGHLWHQRGGGRRDWHAQALLSEAIDGLQIGSDRATRAALARALPGLLDRPIASLLEMTPLAAADLDRILSPNPELDVLEWLNDAVGFQGRCDEGKWSAFLDSCRSGFNFDVEKDGVMVAVQLLCERQGSWEKVWTAFRQMPNRFKGVQSHIRVATPSTLIPLHPGSWANLNVAAEDRLRDALANLMSLSPSDASSQLQALESEHGPRRRTVWSELGETPLANALKSLCELQSLCGDPAPIGSATDMASWYAAEGWRVDRAVMAALGATRTLSDQEAVGKAVRAVYYGWLDAAARAFQEAFASHMPMPDSIMEYPEGACVLFIDGLRYDVAMQIVERLQGSATVTSGWTFASVPSITPTSKYGVSPLAEELHAGPELSASLEPGGPPLTAEGLRKALLARGWQIVSSSALGDGVGRAWCEGGNLDLRGHQLSPDLPRDLEGEVAKAADLVQSLLVAGWRRVEVVTDHGWLYVPGELPKVELPIKTAEIRKARCARVPSAAQVDHLRLPWRWDPSVTIVVPPGIACYEAGKVYEHGGVSLQECVTPHLIIEGGDSGGAITITSVVWVGMRCRIEVEGHLPSARELLVDLRARTADPSTSLTNELKSVRDGKASLIVPDDNLAGSVGIVVVLGAEGAILAHSQTVIGGEN